MELPNISLPGLKSLGISGQSVSSTQSAGEGANQAGASINVGTKFGDMYFGGSSVPVSTLNPLEKQWLWVAALMGLGLLFFLGSFFRRKRR